MAGIPAENLGHFGGHPLQQITGIALINPVFQVEDQPGMEGERLAGRLQNRLFVALH
jgi:hypothetical protein